MALRDILILLAAAAATGAVALDRVTPAPATPAHAAPQDPQKPASQPADAKTAELRPFVQEVTGTDISFAMVPIPAGTFVMGSPADEAGRGEHEGPQRTVAIDAFYMGKCEVTWDEYEQWGSSLEKQRREGDGTPQNDLDAQADAVTRPTPPYTDMTFGMGRKGYPAICMTQLAAQTYCEWLSAKTGKTYRLPTEAEWEYACRAGTTTAYSFGDDPKLLGDYAWFGDNSDYQYQPIGQKKPNPWGLHDMHGNVAEWVQDAFGPYPPAEDGAVLSNPVVTPTELYPRVARGGSWEDPAASLRSAARIGSEEDWKMQDPQIPQSVWYHTDAQFLGFRVVCEVPKPEK